MLLQEAHRMRAEYQLGILAAVSRGFAGGDDYTRYHQALVKQSKD